MTKFIKYQLLFFLIVYGLGQYYIDFYYPLNTSFLLDDIRFDVQIARFTWIVILLLIFSFPKVLDIKASHKQSGLVYMIIVVALVYYYGWGVYGEERTFLHSITAYLKYGFYYFLASNRLANRNKYLMLILTLCFIIFDKSRTSLFVLAGIYALTLKRDVSIMKMGLVLIAGLSIMIWMTFSRSNVDFDIKYLLWPMSVEANFSTYSTKQLMFFVENHGTLSPLIWLKDTFYGLVPGDQLIIEYGSVSYVLEFFKKIGYSERLSPMGGHYWLAEFWLYFRYLSPIVWIFYIYQYLKFVQWFRGPEKIVLLSFSFMLVKSPVWVLLSNIIILLLFVGLNRSTRLFIHNAK